MLAAMAILFQLNSTSRILGVNPSMHDINQSILFSLCLIYLCCYHLSESR